MRQRTQTLSISSWRWDRAPCTVGTLYNICGYKEMYSVKSFAGFGTDAVEATQTQLTRAQPSVRSLAYDDLDVFAEQPACMRGADLAVNP